MKRLLAGIAVAATAASVALVAQAPPKDALIQAMHDEIERSKKMTFNGLEAPYFLEYVLDESRNFSVSATLGGLVTRRVDYVRLPSVHVRVGDYKLDNTNYMSGRFGGGGAHYDLERFPLENAYPLLRRYFWLLTDSAYKAAVEEYSRKQAALRNLQSDQLNDFSRAEPVHHVRAFQTPGLDEDGWTSRTRSLSAIFTRFADVRFSAVEMEESAGGTTVVNTEGTEVREPEIVTFLRARAIGQAPDGMTVHDAVAFHSLEPVRMPGDAELTRGITALAENISALSHAPKGEDYSGPVLFEGMAGAQVMAEVLGRSLTLARRPVAESGRGGFSPGELEGRVGSRVLPESFDVVDDPTQKEWRGRPLFGSYEVDREGVIPKPLRLVEKGVLKGFLLTRQPVRGFEGSNGRARLPGMFGASVATMSNLFVSSSDAVPPGELKKKLIEMCQARGKPYGIIVRKMDFPSSASFEEARGILIAAQGARAVSSPVLVYKVFADGREELVRGVRFRSFNARSLRDIVAAGNDGTVFEYMENGAPFALIGGSTFATEVSVVAPSLLVDDLELHPVEEEQPKLPVVPPPELAHSE